MKNVPAKRTKAQKTVAACSCPQGYDGGWRPPCFIHDLTELKPKAQTGGNGRGRGVLSAALKCYQRANGGAHRGMVCVCVCGLRQVIFDCGTAVGTGVCLQRFCILGGNCLAPPQRARPDCA